jgi:uncharacterized protein (DUF488 family)
VANPLFTIGHSTRSANALIAVLTEAGIETIADVRRFPASRRHPHFNRAMLAEQFAAVGIEYSWLGEFLGGRRGEILPVERSPNRAWTVATFRHYADFMSTPPFRAGVAQLETIAGACRTAILCAEHNWWQCHRRLIADFMTVGGWPVIHLLDPGKRQAHALSEWARVEGGVLTYPALV